MPAGVASFQKNGEWYDDAGNKCPDPPPGQATAEVGMTPSVSPDEVAAAVPVGAPIMAFGKPEPTGCCACGAFTNVELLKQAVVVQNGAVCACCGDRNKTRRMIPRHTIIDYNIKTTTCCWCFGPLATLCQQKDLILYQSNDEKVKLMNGELVMVPIQHSFTLKGANADTLDKNKLAQWVYGPLAAAGSRLHMVSHLINDGVANKMMVNIDLLNTEHVDESAQLDEAAGYTIDRMGCCTFTDAKFHNGFLSTSYKAMSTTSPIANCCTFCMTGCGMCERGIGPCESSMPFKCADPCTMEEHNLTIPRFNVMNYETTEMQNCWGIIACCCAHNTISIQTTSKQTIPTPFGAVQQPIFINMRYDGEMNDNFMQGWVFGDLSRMGDKAHGAAHLINNDLADKLVIREELNRLLSPSGPVVAEAVR